MDGETVRSSSARSKLQCLVLEADKEVETFRAERYYKILSELMEEQDDTAASARRPQPASNNLFMPGGSFSESANRALATPAVRDISLCFFCSGDVWYRIDVDHDLPQLSSYFARERLNVTVPQSQPVSHFCCSGFETID